MRPTKNSKPEGPNIVSGRGMSLASDNGGSYYDISAQTLNLVAGHNHEDIVKSVSDQMDRVSFLSSRINTPTFSEAQNKIDTIFGDTFDIFSFKICSGSMANEHAIKAAKNYSNKQWVFSLEDSYHGQSIGVAEINGRYPTRRYLEPAFSYKFPTPFCANCPVGKDYYSCDVECLAKFASVCEELNNDVAAFLLEPILIEAGIIKVPLKYLKKLRRLCTEFNIVLIFDEVQTCGGWLGSFSFSHTLDKSDRPDVVTLGKAIGAGYPLAAVVLKGWLDTVEYGEHEFTYGGSLLGLSAFVSLANKLLSPEFPLEYVQRERVLGEFCERIKNLAAVNEVRKVGLICGVVLGYHIQLSRADLRRRLLEFGIVCRSTVDVRGLSVIQIKISPLANVEELTLALAALEKALTEI